MAVFYSFLAFVAVFLLVGAASARASRHSPEDYLLASRQVSPMSVGVSGMASTVSGFAFTGLVAFIYLNGYSGGWFSLGMIFGSLAGFALASRRLRSRGQRSGAASFPEYLSARMDGRTRFFGRFTGLLVVAIAVIYATAQLAAGGKVLHVLMDWNYDAGVILGAVIVIAYSWAGGIRASISTDVAQTLVMLLALGILAAVSLERVGGLTGLHEALIRADPALVAVLPAENPFGPWLFVLGTLAIGIGFLGFPHVMIRFMTLKEPRDTVKAIVWYEATFTVLQVMIVLVALSARVLVPDIMALDPELALPATALELLPSILVGVVLAGIFAGAISTADSLVLSSSASLSRDVLPAFSNSYGFMKAGTLATTLLAMLLALGETGSIFELVTYASAVMAAGFAPLLFIAAMGWRIHQSTALAMIVVAVGTASWWRFMGYHQYVFDALPGIVTAFAVYAVGSRASRLLQRDVSRGPGVSRTASRATGRPAAPAARPGRSEE